MCCEDYPCCGHDLGECPDGIRYECDADDFDRIPPLPAEYDEPDAYDNDMVMDEPTQYDDGLGPDGWIPYDDDYPNDCGLEY